MCDLCASAAGLAGAAVVVGWRLWMAHARRLLRALVQAWKEGL